MAAKKQYRDALKVPIKFEVVLPEEWIVYRFERRNQKLMYFVDPAHRKMVEDRLVATYNKGFGVSSQLMYMATYVVNLQTNTMVKNRYPDQDWPKQIFETIFSGVQKDVIEL